MSQNAQIRFSTSILARLGEELTPSPDLGILELVKNAYDANARNCIVELINTDLAGGTIRISDDGDGMLADDIIDGWLVLGRSRKAEQKRTRLERIPAGNKGLGRLAALRMGNKVRLTTKPRSEDEIASEQNELKIDWLEYEKAELVDQVALELETNQCLGCKPGTEIVVDDLRQPVNRSDVKKLARGLLLLADPFGDSPYGFQPELKAPEFKDLEKLVKQRYFDQADYHLVVELDEKGFASARVLDWRGEVLFVAPHSDIVQVKDKKNLPYKCPRAKFEVWVFVLNAETFTARQVSLAEVRTWLSEFGGIHLYQNALRVSPYGNPGNDWLDMNLLRAKNPEERPSTNTVIGRMFVYDENEILIQKTDRAGFIETEIFEELRRFGRDGLEWLAFRRLEQREQRRIEARVETPQESVEKKVSVESAIDTLPREQREKVSVAFKSYHQAREREVKQLREDVQLYRTLSTAGITAATFAHESAGNPIKVIVQAIKGIERRAREALKGNYDKSELDKPIQLIRRSIAALSVLGSATLRLIDHEKRRIGRVDIHTVILEILDVFKPFLAGRRITVEHELCAGNPYLQGSAAAIESIITNLINNSITSFEETSEPDRRIYIFTEISDKSLIIRVLDNGPGINTSEISLRDIWLPGKSTRQNGTGLGLTIVRDAVADLGGKVDAIAHGKYDGAELIIQLPIIGV